MATDRIIIHTSIATEFTDALKHAVNSDADPSLPLPTLVNVASKARVESMISDALSSGAELIHGDVDTSSNTKNTTDKSGVWLAPVILGGVKEDTKIWQEEAFASLAVCKIVDNDEEAIKVANSGGYGLSAAVFTEDLRKGLAYAKRLQSG